MSSHYTPGKREAVRARELTNRHSVAKRFGAGILTLLGCAVSVSGFARVATPGELPSPEPEQQTTVISPDFMSEMAVVAIGPPDAPQIGLNDQLSEVFSEATQFISDTTDGYIRTPQQIYVDTKPLTPGATKEVPEGCYTADQIAAVRAQTREKYHLSDAAQVPVVVYGDTFTCDGVGDAAYALAGQTHYSLRDMENYDNFVRVVGHEIGHGLGLRHSLALAYNGRKNHHGEYPVPADRTTDYDQKDIVHLLNNDALMVAITLKPDDPAAGKHTMWRLVTDAYAGLDTVMGNSTHIEPGGEIYNFVEINHITPEHAPIVDIDPTKDNEYVISINEAEHPRAIRFSIPPEHPLQYVSMMPSFHNVSIGLNHGTESDAFANLAIIGENEDGLTTNIQMTTLYPGTQLTPDMATTERGRLLLYKDSYMGFSVFAKPYMGEGSEQDSVMVLEVRNDHDSPDAIHEPK